MDTPEEPAETGPTERSLVTETHRVRRPLGRLYWLALVLVPVVLTVLVGASRGPGIEDTLESEVDQALAAAGIKRVEVVVDGRQVTAEVPVGRDPEKVEEVVAQVSGVLSVEATEVFASAKEAKACAGLQAKVDRATNKQRIPFSGASTRLTAEGERMVRAVGRLLTACRAGDVTVGGHADTAGDDGALALERARVIIRELKRVGVAADRMQARGYGDQFPVAEGDSAAAKARNQRGSIAVEGQ
jgi:outer membrane protein OmpA-like peptidoglycan-associated protein